MLQLRPSCEHCAAKLPPNSTEAMIWSFECTFCRRCVEAVLGNVCPNCGVGFCARAIRAARRWKDHNYLGGAPASKTPVVKPVDAAAHQAFSAVIAAIPPQSR